MIDKLQELFENKRLQLRKDKWEKRDWEEYHFMVEFRQDWETYLKDLNCKLVGGMNGLVQEWNSEENRNTFCVKDPEHSVGWILMPTELANKALVLGCLP